MAAVNQAAIMAKHAAIDKRPDGRRCEGAIVPDTGEAVTTASEWRPR